MPQLFAQYARRGIQLQVSSIYCWPATRPNLPLPPAAACRGGLVGPWTALSPLMALCTDPLEEIRSRALRMLRHLCDK